MHNKIVYRCVGTNPPECVHKNNKKVVPHKIFVKTAASELVMKLQN